MFAVAFIEPWAVWLEAGASTAVDHLLLVASVPYVHIGVGSE